MRRLLCLALFLCACAPPPAPSQQAIVGGTFEAGEDAVVIIEVVGGVAICTGTLIEPNVVLTAKHCVQPANATEPYPPNIVSIGVGSRQGETTDYRALWLGATPGAYMQNSTTGLTGDIFGVDVGMIVLRRNVEGVTPMAFRRDRPDDMVGQEFTAVGFGLRPDGPSGTKYRGSGILDSIQDNGVLLTQRTICSGDSGGPMIQETPTRQVIGVASFGQANRCPSERDGYNALYNNLDLIDRALVIGGHCPPRGDEECNGNDDDCDGEVDEGCVGHGGACTEDSDCAFAQRPAFLDPVDDPVVCHEGTCQQRCDPLQPWVSCATDATANAEVRPIEGGFVCSRDAGCDAFCAIADGLTTPAVDGASCASDDECISGACEDPGDGNTRCVTPCVRGAGTCPVGDACAPFGETCGACVDSGLLAATRELGEPCEGNDDCADAAGCFDGACTTACSATAPCPSGYRCLSPDNVCVRGAIAGVGERCADDTECQSNQPCIDGVCASACTAPEDCPEGFECASFGGGMHCRTTGPQAGDACSVDGRECGIGSGLTCLGGECVDTCGPTDLCTVGFECRRDGDGTPRCERAGGGCAAVPGGADAPWWLAGFALLLFRRRQSGPT